MKFRVQGLCPKDLPVRTETIPLIVDHGSWSSLRELKMAAEVFDDQDAINRRESPRLHVATATRCS